jgi:aldose 1-epimerase
LSLSTNYHLPTDASWIPISGPTQHPDITPNKSFILGLSEPKFNECFILTQPHEHIPLDTRSLPLKSLVSAYHPDTKIHLEVLSTEPAFQFYTGDYIDVKEIQGEDEVRKRGPRSGFCVEPSRYVNAVNVPNWKEQVLLRKGEVYGSRIVYRGWSDE